MNIDVEFAPITGAWIETLLVPIFWDSCRFAPITGAWIETKLTVSKAIRANFAPITGAWIETTNSDGRLRGTFSHPSRVRGLKLKSSAGLDELVIRTHHGCVD